MRDFIVYIFLTVLFSGTLAVAKTPSVSLIREGSRIVDAEATLILFSDGSPTRVQVGDDGVELVVFPNTRLAEMEGETSKKQNTRFRLSGEVFTYKKGNFLLVRDVTAIGSFAERRSPAVTLSSPDAEDDSNSSNNDSVESIINELKEATGSLTKSIRNASTNPIKRSSTRSEGVRITNRRGHIVRNNEGAWVFVFVADATGLSDPSCTVLPSTAAEKLFGYASKGGFTVPLLVSGEVLTYHGHNFLLLRSWRRVHTADHLDG
jgi:hypothetical protein